MAGKKTSTKARKASNGASGKAANSKGVNKAIGSKPNHNGSGLTANELMLCAWKKIYENKDRFGKFD